jgi:hypothetical protein
VDYHFIQGQVANKLLNVRFIPIWYQIVDGFTKPLSVR